MHPMHYNNTNTLIASGPTSNPGNIPAIIMRDTNGSSDTNPTATDELVKFSDYGKFVFFISTASGAISYFVLLFRVLWPRYIKKSTGRRLWGGEIKEGLLHPFDDSNDIRASNSTSTKLEDDEGAMFFIFITLNIALVIAMLLVLLCGIYIPVITNKKMTNGKYGYIQIPIILVYFYSLLCTTSSCFIFSKVMYGIQNKCDNLFRSNDKTITACIGDNKEFIDMAIESQKPFELWFFIHWVMYIITSFLSLSFLFDAINEKIQGTLPYKQPGLPGVNFSPLELVFIALFAASNSFFFLYPCIRAAGVTESRKKLILDVNKMYDSKNFEERAFVNYLQDKKFSFRLNIFCAHVAFDLNIAYISIFIGL